MESDERGREYDEYLSQEFAAEHDRRKENESRAQRLITMSAALFGLMSAVLAFSPLAQQYTFPFWVRAQYGGALAMLAATIVVAVYASRQFRYRVLDRRALQHLLTERYKVDDSMQARYGIARIRIEGITSLRKGNNATARLLLIGQYCQLGFFALAITSVCSTFIFGTPADPIDTGE